MSESKSGKLGLKKQLINIAIVVGITAIVFAVILGNTKEFSFNLFFNFLKGLNIYYVIGAFLCMALFIIFEGLSLNGILKELGYKRKFKQGLIYSTSDIYYSAITPSATGGQPASVYYMTKDDVPVSAATACVTYNIFMYTASIMFIALFAFIAKPSFFLQFDFVFEVLIVGGIVIQGVILTLFLLLMIKPVILSAIIKFIFKFLNKLKIVKNVDKKMQKLEKVIASYKTCIDLIGNNKKLALKAFLLNLAQRVSQMAIAVFIYLAAGIKSINILEVFVLQSFCLLGANSVPIPGAAGVSEGLYINAFNAFMSESVLINCMMATRGIAYYICFILSGVLTLIHHIVITFKAKKRGI